MVSGCRERDVNDCLECGKEMIQLTVRHLSSHEMSQKEYRKKYGFTIRTPLAAKSLTKTRSKAAKKRGLPEKLQEYIEGRSRQRPKALFKRLQGLMQPTNQNEPDFGRRMRFEVASIA